MKALSASRSNHRFFSILILAVASMIPAFATADDCPGQGASQALCRKMRALSSQIDILEVQRDLMQVNYALLGSNGNDMMGLTQRLQKDNAGAHIPPLVQLEQDSKELKELAAQNDSNALTVANSVKNNCLSCHSNSHPSSGIRWEDTSYVNWQKAVTKCNEEITHGTNPYLCKSMYAMKTMSGYFLRSFLAGNENYENLAEVSKEIGRISEDLITKNVVHGGANLLKSVSTESKILASMARAKNPAVFKRANDFAQSCTSCHGH